MANKTVTIRPSGGDYPSLAGAFAGEYAINPDLRAGAMDGNLYMLREGNWATADGNRAPMPVFQTDATHRVIIIDTSTGAGIEASSGADGTVVINTPYTEVYGLRVRDTSGAGYAGLLVHNTDHVLIDGCYVYDCGWHGIFVRGSSDDCCVRNCIVSRCPGHAGIDFYTVDRATTHYSYNNVAQGCGEGIVAGNGTTVHSVNDYAGNNTTNFAVNGTGTFAELTTCYSPDGSRGTSVAPYSTATFVSVTNGSEDFHLVEGSALIESGTDLSNTTHYPFALDRAGDPRSNPWDVGVYEYSQVAPVPVTGVTLDRETATIEEKQTVQLTATVAPVDATNKNVTWSSSHSNIASVNASGLVSGVSQGQTVITVTTQDGGFTDTCAVTVNPETVYRPGDTFLMPAANRTFYAKWNILDSPVTINHTNFDPSGFSNADITSASGLKVYFEHASTGQDIVGNSNTDSSTGQNYDSSGLCGLALLHGVNDRYSCDRSSFDTNNDPTWFSTHSGLQSNHRGNPTPALKLSGFLGISENMWNAIHVAIMKHCWIDVWPSVEGYITDGIAFANTTIAAYEVSMASHLGVVHVFMTMPLQTNASYQARQDFNATIRAYCLANSRWLWDIADIQCHTTEGVIRLDIDGREVMVEDYAVVDGGHLSEAGSLRIAQSYWTLITRIARLVAEEKK